MISLSDFVSKRPITCDAHTHLFDGLETDLSLLLPESKLTVTFADIKYLDPDSYAAGVIPQAYDKFIAKSYPKIKDKVILLSTSAIAEEAIAIQEKYPEIIKGFGEFQCYEWSTSQSEELPYGNLKWIEPVIEYNQTKKLPVYIHYDMLGDDRVKDLDKLLNKNPDMPIVLCHCGMNRCIDNYGALDTVSRLMSVHVNLWTDISYEALELFASDKNAIKKLPDDRILIGSDLNPVIKNRPPQEARVAIDSILMNMEVVNGYGVDFYGNLVKLFNLGK